MAPLSYFDRFPGFTPNPHDSIASEFARLASHYGWQTGQKKWERQWTSCCRSEVTPPDRRSHESKLQAWQDLCAEVGIVPTPPSITKCKKVCHPPVLVVDSVPDSAFPAQALSKVHINLVDLMDARRQGRHPRLFESYDALTEWTLAEKGRMFPRKVAKKDGFVRVLLKVFP